MNNINIGTLNLCEFDKENKEHLELFKKLIKDKSISLRFQGLLNTLMSERNKEIFDKGYLLKDNQNFVGYMYIGAYNENEKCVYLREAIDNNARGNNYGKTALKEVSEYLFQTYAKIEQIKLKIAPDNIPSLKTAEACGYKWERDDFYYLENQFLKQKNIR